MVEAFNDTEEEFSDERLIDIIKREQTRPLEEVVDTILEGLKDFCARIRSETT